MRSGWVVWAVWAIWCGCVGFAWDQVGNCNRNPLGIESPRIPGDNGYKIKISGNPEKYVPGEVYTVSLQGWRTQYSVQKFTGFMLVVEASQQTQTNLYGPRSVGTFQLYGDALTMHSEDCPNAVIQTSSISKSEIQVLWTAPPAGSGCVIFRATVVENRDQWYKDDGELSRELCEEVQENEDKQPEVIYDCCACDEAKYEVTFEGMWSRHTHPKDFPSNAFLTHFSDIIGASHSANYRVWEYGGFSSDGLRQVAEWGSTRALESELKQQSDHIRTIIKARGLWYPNVNGKTFAVFRVDNRHHLMSLVSMLGPSPDWIVGVSALELCLRNCSWVDQKTLNLYPWDAGTDSGVTYESANAPTIPREKIRRITNNYPNDPKSPFYDPTGLPMKPLARLTITRQRVYEKSCSDTSLLPGYATDYTERSDDDSRPECHVTSWSHWTTCSATCGKGLRTRTRTYLMPMKASMSDCQRQLEEKEMCAASVTYCPGGSFIEPEAIIDTVDQRVCVTTEWSSWSHCSATCGEGQRMRNRRYLNRMGRKKCLKPTTEKDTCVADTPVCDDDPGDEISPDCAVTQWTDWSPCSVTCGEGAITRTRHFLVPAASRDNCYVKRMDKRPCFGERRNCTVDPEEREVPDCNVFRRLNLSIHDQMQFEVWCKLGRDKTADYTHSEGKLASKDRQRNRRRRNEVCMQEREGGPCRGSFIRWYFNPATQTCKDFNFGGCRGNRNNFESYEECMQMCGMNAQPGAIYADPGPMAISGDKVDCMVTEWSEWSPCSATCGRGRKEKIRMIKVHPQNNGKKCPRKLKKTRKCNEPKCNDGYNGLKSMSLRRDEHLVPFEPDTHHKPKEHHSHSHYENYEEYIAPALFNPPPLEDPHGPETYGGHIYLHGSPEDHFDDGTKDDCVMGEWGPWSPCTHSCGEALQQRSRTIIVSPRNGGTPCGDRFERRYCTLPPCSPIRG
ncbi:spondin-1-like isoform X2 [Macrobrachium nipponense]|uniref:spondin-1-like isoform X2 n=1 Tax=Macrobrachium nipponense TaxID=159736 RepID=UPI0030C7FF35